MCFDCGPKAAVFTYTLFFIHNFFYTVLPAIFYYLALPGYFYSSIPILIVLTLLGILIGDEFYKSVASFLYIYG